MGMSWGLLCGGTEGHGSRKERPAHPEAGRKVLLGRGKPPGAVAGLWPSWGAQEGRAQAGLAQRGFLEEAGSHRVCGAQPPPGRTGHMLFPGWSRALLPPLWTRRETAPTRPPPQGPQTRGHPLSEAVLQGTSSRSRQCGQQCSAGGSY